MLNAPNTSVAGSVLVSRGDGQGTALWRPTGVWWSGTPSNTSVGIGTAYQALAATAAGAVGGFTTYKVDWSFASTSTGMSVAGQIFAGIDVISTSTPAYAYQVGYATASSTPAFSGSLIITTATTAPVQVYLFCKTGSGIYSAAFGNLVVTGIS